MAERQQPDERDVDAIFASIVARWDDVPAPGHADADADADTDAEAHAEDGARPPEPRHQSTGDVRLPPPPVEDTDPGTSRPDPVPWRTDPTNSVADALLGNDDAPGVADDDEGFTPPPPAPLPPATDRLFWGAITGLVLGPLGLIWIALAQPGGFWPKAIVIGLIIGGFACLFLRQPTTRGHDPDQGARV